ncbi:MAG TPA: serine/threonine-protein kinase [Polyangiaceae bacterium]|nr:serine/threonine-protein kinase [Polyangiaceae bacterium]
MTNEAPGTALAPGRLIAGRFRLERLLGKGGMGSVWVARHLNLDVDVALKFIDPATEQLDDAAQRFAREAMAGAMVKSPHVVNVIDFGADAFGRPYLAMELLQGEELAQRIERWGRLPLADVCHVVVQACRGLERAHAAGFVHRDLKPENIFLVSDDEGFTVKLFDFGIAKALKPLGTVSHQTNVGHIVGTPLYMSPEQALGRADVDHRSDLYSLAVVAFYALTGQVPFLSDALGELIVKVTTHAAPSVRALRSDLPKGLDAWFVRALQKKPAKRFQSAREMADAFARACGAPASMSYLGSAPPPAPPSWGPTSGPAGAAPGPGHQTLIGATTSSTKARVRPWSAYGIAGMLGFFLLGLLPLFLTLKREAPPRPRPTASLPRAVASGPSPAPASSAAVVHAAQLVAPASLASPPKPAAPAGAPKKPGLAPEAHAGASAPRPAPHAAPAHAAPTHAAPTHARHAAPKAAPRRGKINTDWGLD